MRSSDRPRCRKARCFSPIACAGFGYCRERNCDGLPSEAEAAEWRRLDRPEVDDGTPPTVA